MTRKCRPINPIMLAIRAERQRQKISLEKLATLTGYGRQHLWQMEAGRQGVEIDIVSNLAQALGKKLTLEDYDG